MWKSESKQMSPPQDIVGLSYKIKSPCLKYKKSQVDKGFAVYDEYIFVRIIEF